MPTFIMAVEGNSRVGTEPKRKEVLFYKTAIFHFRFKVKAGKGFTLCGSVMFFVFKVKNQKNGPPSQSVVSY